MTARRTYCRGSTGVFALIALLTCAPAARAQSLTMQVTSGAVHVRVPGWSFLDGEPLVRLRDGRTVRIELVATALPAPGRSPIAAARQVFSLSYDLWEERFAVAIAGTRASISHLTAAAAEAWCVEQMAIPVASLGSPNDLRFWMRLEVRILDGDAAADPDAESGLTLQRLIDVLSRRRKNDSPARAIEGGPFRLPPR